MIEVLMDPQMLHGAGIFTDSSPNRAIEVGKMNVFFFFLYGCLMKLIGCSWIGLEWDT